MTMEQEAVRLQQKWACLFQEFNNNRTPSLTQFFVWLSRFSPDCVEQAMLSTLRCAFKMSQQEPPETMHFYHQVNYCNKTMWMITEEEVEKELKQLEPAHEKVKK
jgi:hypothetical protein